MNGNAPNFVAASLWQTPQAFTLIRTSPAAGAGISRSTSSKSPPALPTCATRFFAIFHSPFAQLALIGACLQNRARLLLTSLFHHSYRVHLDQPFRPHQTLHENEGAGGRIGGVHVLVAHFPHHRQLRRIHPCRTISIQFDDANSIAACALF